MTLRTLPPSSALLSLLVSFGKERAGVLLLYLLPGPALFMCYIRILRTGSGRWWLLKGRLSKTFFNVIVCRKALWFREEMGENKQKNQHFSIFFDKIHITFPIIPTGIAVCSTVVCFLTLQLFSVLRRSAFSFCSTSLGFWLNNQTYL